MAARIRDVARRAGVSQAAVSFVINGRFDQLSDATIKRVQQAIEELDFQPSAIARSLATQRSGTVGVLVSHLRHPVLNFIASALVVEARKHDINVLIWDEVQHAPVDAGRLETMLSEQITRMIGQRVDGLIASTPLREEDLARLAHANIPVVAIDRPTPGIDSVYVDFEVGDYLAARHLAGLGRTRLMCLGGFVPGGIERAVSQHPSLELVHAVRAIERPIDAYNAVVRALAAGVRFDAIFVASDWFAIGVYRALQEAQLAIPGDVAVVGFDDTFAAFYSPALTSISQPFDRIGSKAFQCLLQRIGGLTEPPRDLRIEPQLVVRESCGAAHPHAAALLQDVWERDIHPHRP